MSLFEWKDEYSVKIEEIDNQHRKLVSILNELHSSMLAARANEVIQKTLDELINYTITHFRAEESLMTTYQYPDYDTHKQAHENFVSKVKLFYDDFKSGKKMVSVEILFFLKDWLVNHINGVDKKYSQFFNNKGIK